MRSGSDSIHFMSKSYFEELRQKAASTEWASCQWRIIEANETLRKIKTVEDKLRLITRARGNGLTWPELARSIHYGANGPPDEVDWARAGKSLHAWYSKNANDDADADRRITEEVAVEDLQQAQLDLEHVNEYAQAEALEAINDDAAMSDRAYAEEQAREQGWG